MSTLYSYPATLPLPQLAPYQLTPVDNTVRTELATGHVIQREIAPNAPTRMSARWRLSADQAALLEGWVAYVVKLGYWTMPVLVPAGLIDHQVRLLGPLGSRKPLGAARWEISATVEIRRAQTWSEQQAVDALLAPATTESFVDAIESAINQYTGA